ncbi:nickel/cobalt transporter [Vibrio mediterranei]|nr:nickel/cobalt transporter [Vibrio mediterranei]EDL55839.1 hypothetical membrane protein [Vibrio mediterranei AK1]
MTNSKQIESNVMKQNKNNVTLNNTKEAHLHYRRIFVAIVVSILLVVSLYLLWQAWPSLVVMSIQWQREVNAQLADLLYDAQTQPLIAGGYLIGASFLYGMLHSIGPGHGKVIVTTYLATHPTKVKTSLVLTVISALCQALVAIVLVSVLVWGFNASMQAVNRDAMIFVSISFALVALLGGIICWKAAAQIFKLLRSHNLKIRSLAPLSSQNTKQKTKLEVNPATYAIKPSPIVAKATGIQHHHSHGDNCGCGHQHVVSAQMINEASTWKEYLGIVASIGVRPCSGAIMVLLFANVVGLYWMGVISAILMGLGTALTTSLIALMTLSGKHILKRYLVVTNSEHSVNWKLTGSYLKLVGGVILMIIGLLFMGGQDYGMSPVLLS